MLDDLRDERTLLLRSAVVGLMPPDALEARRLAERSLNWNWLVAEAAQHRIAGLFHRALAEMDALDRVPSDQLAALEREMYRRRRSAEWYFAELAELNRRVGGDTKMVLLKGMAFVGRLYEDGASRAFNDVDLLVAGGDTRRVCRALESMGYSPTPEGVSAGDGPHTPRERRIGQLFDAAFIWHLSPYIKPIDDPTAVRRQLKFEVHRDVVWRTAAGPRAYPVDIEEMMANAVRGHPLADFAWVLSSIHNLLHCCLDFYRDANTIERILRQRDIRLIKLSDIARLCRTVQGEGKWSAFIALCSRCAEAVYYALYCLAVAFPALITLEQVEALKPDSLDYLDEFGMPWEVHATERPRWRMPLPDRLVAGSARRDEALELLEAAGIGQQQARS